ncbi:shikimate dehydrogenase, partial [Halobacteriales archaeon QH_6_66_25]
MDVYGLIGNPVEHSLSPPMHEAAYDTLGIEARYVTF